LEQSSRFERGVAVVAAAGALAIGAVAVTGCGSDDETDSINEAIDSVQSQAQSVQSQVSSAATSVQEQVQSVQSEAQGQIESVQSQIQEKTQTQSGGGY
jgi:predicted PurR-regulated permease PerM